LPFIKHAMAAQSKQRCKQGSLDGFFIKQRIESDADNNEIKCQERPSLLFQKSFNCRYNPRMDYAFCLLTLKSSEKWRSPYIIWCYRQLQSQNSTLLYTRDVNRF
jgi:hypothetical protein